MAAARSEQVISRPTWKNCNMGITSQESAHQGAFLSLVAAVQKSHQIPLQQQSNWALADICHVQQIRKQQAQTQQQQMD
jgi:hypothetical protein